MANAVSERALKKKKLLRSSFVLFMIERRFRKMKNRPKLLEDEILTFVSFHRGINEMFIEGSPRRGCGNRYIGVCLEERTALTGRHLLHICYITLSRNYKNCAYFHLSKNLAVCSELFNLSVNFS